jgi:6-phosphogluconolactonase
MRPNLVYVGTYTRTGYSEGIYVFERDPASGKLTPLHVVTQADPSFLAFSPDKRFLYAVSELNIAEGNGSEAFSCAIDQETGNLTPLSHQVTSGGQACHLTTDPSGRWLLVANHEDGSVVVFPIDGDGKLGPLTQKVQHRGSGPGPSQKGPHAHFVTFDPPQQHVLVNDKGIDKTMIYRLNTDTGTLTPNDPPFATLHAGAAPRHLAFHPNGRFVYVIGEADLTITAFTYDGSTGTFTELHYLSTLPEGATGERLSTAQVLVEPSGHFVYVSNRGHDSIAIFAIDQQTGRLTAVGHEPTQGQTPRNFNIDPSGTYLYAANQNSNTIVQFTIDKATGKLTPTGDVTPVGGPVCILFA